MSSAEAPTPLSAHTLDTLCRELVSGRGVISEDGSVFALESLQARAIFKYYLDNQTKWPSNATRQEAEAVTDQLAEEPPVLAPATLADTDADRRIIHLKEMRVHRFAGIHSYGMPNDPPEDFVFTFDRRLTTIEGKNGSGKTSLLNAIVWCLTGAVFRSQRAPDPVDGTIPVRSEGAQDDEHDMAAITPKPSSAALAALGADERVPLDTWVELSFVDGDENPVGAIRRGLSRTPRGRMVPDPPDLSVLGLDPMSIEIGTRMPGLIPYVQLEEKSELGDAVASLTGLRPLQDLAKHAQKTQRRLRTEMCTAREQEIAYADQDYAKAQAELEATFREHKEIALDGPVPSVGPAPETEEALTQLVDHLTVHQETGLADCANVLGGSFDPKDPDDRRSLLDDIGPALSALDPGSLRRLDSAHRAHALAGLAGPQIAAASQLVGRVVSQARELADLAREPRVAPRVRLYDRIAAWIADHPELPVDLAKCPVCQTPLEGKLDPITRRPVPDHIKECCEAEAHFLSQTIAEWEEQAVKTLRHELPAALQAEMDRTLPNHPDQLMADALAVELFESKCFKGALASLKGKVQTLCDRARADLPPFEEPALPDLAEEVGRGPDGLAAVLGRVARAIAFAQWRRANDTAWAAALAAVLGTRTPARPEEADAGEHGRGLAELLQALNEAVQTVEPVTRALSRTQDMLQALAKRRKLEARIERHRQAADAMEPIVGLERLVMTQVGPLVTRLAEATVKWRDALYQPACVNGPRVESPDVRADGAVIMDAESDGTAASARELSNTSDLRATLLAFLLAFRQHLLERRGGLSLLLLDDPQALFDPQNCARLAQAIPSIIDSGARAVVTTSDRGFGRRLEHCARRKLGAEACERRTIRTLNGNRECIELAEYREEIDRRRRQFEANEDDHDKAREYIAHLRVYLEGQLVDVLPKDDPDLDKQPTLSSSVNAIRRLRRRRIEPYMSRAFQGLVDCPRLRDGSPFVDLMNDAHHHRWEEITYGRVHLAKSACVEARRLSDAAWVQFDLWMQKGIAEPAGVRPVAPGPSPFPMLRPPMVASVAAFASEGSSGAVLESADRLDVDWLTNHTLYVINADNFGFAAMPGCIAIASLSEEDAEDHSLVIALHRERTYARRLLRYRDDPSVVGLYSEAKNPLERHPSILLPVQEVRLLEIVGLLFPDKRPPSPTPGEAAETADANVLAEIEIACEVDGESAMPLALPHQWILGGAQLAPSDLDAVQGALVAVATSVEAYFKRVGPSVPGAPHIRLLEPIGGGGSSVLVQTQPTSDDDAWLPDLPVVHCARKVLGVLYRPRPAG